MSRRGILFGLLFAAPLWLLIAAVVWFATTDTAARMWTGFIATWPIWAFLAGLTWLCIAVERTCRRYKRNQRIADVRAEENRKTLAHIRGEQQREQARAARARWNAAPSNQRTPAEWFDRKPWAESHAAPEVPADRVEGLVRLEEYIRRNPGGGAA